MDPIIAIVGRPNVGKSTLFNKMIRQAGAGEVLAITEKEPGVTRDRNYRRTEWEGRSFLVVDTGGFYSEVIPNESKEIARQVREQAMFAIEEADVIVHLLDGKEGLNPSDMELATVLRKSGKKVLWVVNKIDLVQKEINVVDFYGIGADEILPVSAMSGLGFDEFMDSVIASVSWQERGGVDTTDMEDIPRIAIIGRPNVGKSTLINALLGKQRLIVSPVPGTTRDAVDSICTHYGKKYMLIDTAGIRKKARGYSVESFSVVRAIRSIERADVAVIVLDASSGILEQDQKIAGIAEEYGKGALILLNKWDLITDSEETYKKMMQELRRKVWFMEYAPCITISGLEKKRITKIFSVINDIIKERRKKIPTPELNKVLGNIIASRPFPPYRGKALKFFYITQTGTEPPIFTIFVNYPAGVKKQYIAYLEKALREEFSFAGTPVRISIRAR